MKQLFIIVLCVLALAACDMRQGPFDSEDANLNRIVKEFFPKEYSDSEWVKTYARFILDSLDAATAIENSSLCHIDDDDIPELCLYWIAIGEGSLILTQHNGVVDAIGFGKGISPEYIERTGLIKVSCHHLDRSLDQYIYKLSNGRFEQILKTEAVWFSGDVIHPLDHPDSIVYSINGKVVETIRDENATEQSCQKIGDAIYEAFYSEGKSQGVFGAFQGE